MENGQVINMNYISSLNFRIARQKIGCSNRIINEILDLGNNSVHNTLIISPPGCGKTTLLRDIIRNVSNGIKILSFAGKTVGVADERGEIAAMYKGVPQNDVGVRTDVIDNMPKPYAMRILVRSMAPDVIACDEIGSQEDVEAIDYAVCSGVKGVFTAHGKDLEEIEKNPELSKLINKHIFERIVISPSARCANETAHFVPPISIPAITFIRNHSSNSKFLFPMNQNFLPLLCLYFLQAKEKNSYHPDKLILLLPFLRKQTVLPYSHY